MEESNVVATLQKEAHVKIEWQCWPRGPRQQILHQMNLAPGVFLFKLNVSYYVFCYN